MDFEILGKIEGIETFATGSGIREIGAWKELTGKGDGGSVRASQMLNWLMALFVEPRYIGTKLLA